jgi:beta-glucosidase-like glycosyl hydrolase
VGGTTSPEQLLQAGLWALPGPGARSISQIAGFYGERLAPVLDLPFEAWLPELDLPYQAGDVPEALLDRSVRRLLRLKFELGLFERWTVDPHAARAPCQTPETRALARTLAGESLVLLKNDADLLPLDPVPRTIAVVGPCADDVRVLQGDYHYPAHLEIVYRRHADDGGAVLPRSEASRDAIGDAYANHVAALEFGEERHRFAGGLRKARSITGSARHPLAAGNGRADMATHC